MKINEVVNQICQLIPDDEHLDHVKSIMFYAAVMLTVK